LRLLRPTCRAPPKRRSSRYGFNNPREVTYQDVFAIYSEALDGKNREAA
jgi:hypothetical protein